MQRGPDNVIACPRCGGLARVFTLLSGNTFGVLAWTDGYRYALMLPAPPPLTRCPDCQTFFWVEDARVIGQCNRIPPSGYAEVPEPRIEPWAWLRAPEIRWPSAQECDEALAAGLADTAPRERALRILAWWRHNDAYRTYPQHDGGRRSAQAGEGSAAAADAGSAWSLPPAATANLERLISLLDVTQAEDRFLAAEALRELGRFEQAEALLAQPVLEDLRAAARFILDLACRRIRELRELPQRSERGQGDG